MDDLIAFLRAQYDERELMLRTVSPVRMAWATFRHADGSMRYTSVVSANGDVWVCDGHAVEPDSVQVVFDRDHELADVAAKRQIIEAHQSLWRDEPPEHLGPGCKTCSGEVEGWPCTTLRLLALPHAGHPDYREEWKP